MGKAVKLHTRRESTALTILLLFFEEIISLLVVEPNRCYHQFQDNSDDSPSPQREVKEAEMFAFYGSDITDGTCSSRQTG